MQSKSGSSSPSSSSSSSESTSQNVDVVKLLGTIKNIINIDLVKAVDASYLFELTGRYL